MGFARSNLKTVHKAKVYESYKIDKYRKYRNSIQMKRVSKNTSKVV